MNAETIFLICNIAVMPSWLLMVVAPRWRFTLAFTRSLVVPALMAATYIACAALTIMGGGEGGMGSLADIRLAFEGDAALLMAWVHYLCFDLVVGTWIAADARRHKMPHLAVAPCLVLTLMLGPLGWLLYMVLRGSLRRVWAFDADPAPRAS